MAQSKEPIHIISKDILVLIPKFNGDQNLLKLFIKKVDYVLSNFSGPKNDKQATYEFHVITSRLRGKAAALFSETDEIITWDQLKEVLIQHFGDPRTEESLAIELENLKIKFNETYLEFYRRIQQIRSSLLSKVAALTCDDTKADKRIIYNNLALNVFLYNLTEDLFRIVRSKSCNTLEKALKVVLEEVNFQIQYNARNKEGFTDIGLRHRTPWSVLNPCVPGTQNFRFGIPQPQNVRPFFGVANSNNSTTFGSAPQGSTMSLTFGSAPQGGGLFGAQSVSKPANASGLRFGTPSQENRPDIKEFAESLYGNTSKTQSGSNSNVNSASFPMNFGMPPQK